MNLNHIILFGMTVFQPPKYYVFEPMSCYKMDDSPRMNGTLAARGITQFSYENGMLATVRTSSSSSLRRCVRAQVLFASRIPMGRTPPLG